MKRNYYFLIQVIDEEDDVIGFAGQPPDDKLDECQKNLNELESLVWGKVTLDKHTNSKLIESTLKTRRRMIAICANLAKIHPDKKLKGKFNTNAKGLAKYIDVRFNTEGWACACKTPGCKRLISNSQVSYVDGTTKSFAATKGMCFSAAKVVYDKIYSDRKIEYIAGHICANPACHRDFRKYLKNEPDYEPFYADEDVNQGMAFCVKECWDGYRGVVEKV